MPYKKIFQKMGNGAANGVAMGEGLQEVIRGRRERKAAAEDMPSLVDPQQSAFLAELQQKRNALNTGAEYSSSLGAVNDNMISTQNKLAGNSGGDVGGTVSALLGSQQVANRGTGQILAQGQQNEGMYNGLYGDLMDKIVNRKLQLGLLKHSENLTQANQDRQDGMANLSAGAQEFLNTMGNSKQLKAKQGSTNNSTSDNNTSSDENQSGANASEVAGGAKDMGASGASSVSSGVDAGDVGSAASSVSSMA